MSNPFDNVEEGNVRDDGYVELPRKKSVPDQGPRYIPAQTYPSPDEEGTFIQTPPAIARGLNKHRKTSYNIYQGAGRPLKGPEIKCDYSNSPDVHSGPATHFIRLPGVPREGTEAVCDKHLDMARKRAVERGDRIQVHPIEERHIESFKLLRRFHKQETLAAMQTVLLNKGMTGENLQIGPEKFKGKQPRPSFPSLTESTSPIDPNWDPNVMPPRGKKVDYKFPKRTTEIKPGKVSKGAEPSPALSDEELRNMSPATRNMVEGRRARGVPATGLRQYSSFGISPMPMAYKPKPEAVEAAFTRIAEEAEPTVQGQVAIEAQAAKQRKIEQTKRSPEFRAAIEAQARQSKPKELE